jgi:hypothetical protein
MRNSERGGSQMPLVICIVLLLVAGFFAYHQYGYASDLEGKLNTILDAAKEPSAVAPPQAPEVIRLINFAKTTGAKQKGRLEEVVAVTGGTDDDNPDLVVSPTKLRNSTQKLLDALDKGTYVIEFDTERFIESPDGGIKAGAAGSKVTVNYGGTKDLRGAKPDMTNVMDYVVTLAMNRMVADIKRYRTAYNDAVTAKDTAEASYKQALAGKDAEIKAKVEEMAALEGSKNQTIAELRRQVSDGETAKTTAEAEQKKVSETLTAENKMLKARLEEASGAVQVLKSRRRDVEKDTSPDGSVLSVGERQDFAVIDIGRVNNNLLAGTNFDVYAIGKGGQEIPKGAIKVMKVDATSAECRVLEVFDALNPVSPGDKVRSYFYSPKETIHVAMVGRFQKMGKSDAARRLQSLGVVVDEKVTINTTYLIIGDKEAENQPIEDTAEYKEAAKYGIPLITERELSKFTMY